MKVDNRNQLWIGWFRFSILHEGYCYIATFHNMVLMFCVRLEFVGEASFSTMWQFDLFLNIFEPFWVQSMMILDGIYTLTSVSRLKVDSDQDRLERYIPFLFTLRKQESIPVGCVPPFCWPGGGTVRGGCCLGGVVQWGEGGSRGDGWCCPYQEVSS